MESLSRPFHRRKLSNATTFSNKNAYDGVFSGHRSNFAGAPATKVEDYREIFGTAQSDSSIPVLDVSALEGSSIGSNSELGRTKPDYGEIFGGFRDEDVAVSYEELMVRDKDRVTSSTSPNSQDLDDQPHQPSDVLKQFNMSYHKISQRNNDGLDRTTHVTQLHAVPGFTCFIEETTPSKEPENQKPSIVDNTHPLVDSQKEDLPEKLTSETSVKSTSKDCRDESLSDDRTNKTFGVDIKSNASQDYQKRSTSVKFGSSKTDTPGDFFPAYFDEELDVNSAAAASAAALQKAIEKAQESIRIAKESVGRKKEGLRSFSSTSFKDSLKVKARPENASKVEERKGNFERVGAASQFFLNLGKKHKNGGNVGFADFTEGEKFFGAKKVVEETHVKVSEMANKKSEIPEAIGLDSDGKYEHATISSEPVEKNTYEAYAQRPRGFLEIENLEKKLEETEDIEDDSKENKDEFVEGPNNLTVYVQVEDEKITPRKLNEEIGLLENDNKKVLEQENVEKVENADVDGNDDTGEKFYDVYEPETNEISQTNVPNLGKSEVSDCEMKEREIHEVAELDINENSSSDYDDAEENESASQEVDDVSTSTFQVENTDYTIEEQELFETISVDQTASEDECEGKSDHLSNCGLSDVDFELNKSDQNDFRSVSSSDTIHGMEIEVNECKERSESESDKKDEVKENKPIKGHEEKEREKNRLAAERAIREARERAFAEARERAERAAVERVNAEVRERVMADAREKVFKASVGARPSDRASEQAKLRAERAAVERATSEARQRALEKAMSQKNIVPQRTSVTQSQDSQSSNGTESAQRSKAKLEKHNRIMERAAIALAEKEKRDMLVQKELAERNRLAENLDADIKRWSSGKEGNLRALLSTLQYILGPDSGWQAISLTEIIMNNAVKKAYRKATLCVHPDKLQQRGASIQQKYICEKVFDLLKAAWSRFNSEERSPQANPVGPAGKRTSTPNSTTTPRSTAAANTSSRPPAPRKSTLSMSGPATTRFTSAAGRPTLSTRTRSRSSVKSSEDWAVCRS